MFLRLRWFVYGAATATAAGMYTLAKLRRWRERLTPRNLARASALSVADRLEVAGRRLAPVPRSTPEL